MGRQEASDGGETRLADTSSTAVKFPTSSSTSTQQHLGSGVLAGKKPQESGEACGEPQRSSDARGERRATSETCMEQRNGSEVPMSLPSSNKRSKNVSIKNSEKTARTTGRKRPLSDASGSLGARKAAKVINAKVDKTKLQEKSKTVRQRVSPIVSSSPAMNIMARNRMQTRSPKATTSLKSPSLHDLSPAATTGAPNSMHNQSPADTTGIPNAMHDWSPAATNGSKQRPRKLRSIIWIDAEPIYIGGFLMQGRCKYCNSVFPASKVSGTSQLARHLKDHFPKQAHLMSEQPDLHVTAVPRSQKKVCSCQRGEESYQDL